MKAGLDMINRITEKKSTRTKYGYDFYDTVCTGSSYKSFRLDDNHELDYDQSLLCLTFLAKSVGGFLTTIHSITLVAALSAYQVKIYCA